MKKFSVLIKDISNDYTLTENIWLTINDYSDSYHFIKEDNKKELILGVCRCPQNIPIINEKRYENLAENYKSLAKIYPDLNLYYINSQNNTLETTNPPDIFTVLFKRNKNTAYEFIDSNVNYAMEKGDTLIGFDKKIPDKEYLKIKEIVFRSKGISYLLLKDINIYLKNSHINCIPLFLIDDSPHQSYVFPIKSTLKTVSLTIDMIRDKVLSHNSEKIWQIETVLHEALVNAITYGNEMDYNKLVIIRYEIGDKGLRVIIKDSGEGFDLKNISVPVGEEALERISGRGIYIMKKFSDAMYYNKKGNEVMLFFNF